MDPKIGSFTRIAQTHGGNSDKFVKATEEKGLYVGKKFSMAGLLGGDRLKNRAEKKAEGFKRVETALRQQYGSTFASKTLKRMGITAQTGVTQSDINRIQAQATKFEAFIDSEHSSENKTFLQNVTSMVQEYGLKDQKTNQLITDDHGTARHLDLRSVPAFKEDMKELFKSHIAERSEFEVNISYRDRGRLTRSMARIDSMSDDEIQTLFQDLQKAGQVIGVVMNDTGQRFESKVNADAKAESKQIEQNLEAMGLI